MNIQLKKGVLELCVLSLLSQKNFYGYELINTISKYITISDGTIYPILRKLTKEGYTTTYLKESLEGPPRKYYRLTSNGYNHKDNLQREWLNFQKAVNNIIIRGYECE